MAQFSELSEDVILHIFSFIPFRLLRRTICRVCKMWHRIASDPAIVRKASSHEFESIRLCDTINECQLKNLVKRIVWARTEDIIVFDLAKTSISWEYVDDASRRSHWRKLRVLNIAKLVTSEFQVSTTLANLLELNVCKSEFSDNHLLEVSRMCKTLRILNVSGCRITDLGVENVSLESLVFFNIANCSLLSERSIRRVIESWETTSLCVKGLDLSLVQFQELYGDDMEAGVVFLCGLLPNQVRKCIYCRESIFLTWTDATQTESLSRLEI